MTASKSYVAVTHARLNNTGQFVDGYTVSQAEPGFEIQSIEVENFSRNRVLISFATVGDQSIESSWDAMVSPYRRRVVNLPSPQVGVTVASWAWYYDGQPSYGNEQILYRVYDAPQAPADAPLGSGDMIDTPPGSAGLGVSAVQSGSWSVNQATGSSFSVIQQSGDVWSVGGAGGGPISISGTITATQGGTWSVSQATGSTFQVIQQTGSVFTVGGSGNFQIINSPGTVVYTAPQFIANAQIAVNIAGGAGIVKVGTFSIPSGATGFAVQCGGANYEFWLVGTQSGGEIWPNSAGGLVAGAGASVNAGITSVAPFLPIWQADTTVDLYVNFGATGTVGTRQLKSAWLTNAPWVFPVNYGSVPLTVVPAPNSQIAPGSTASSTGGAITSLSTFSYTLSSGLTKPANIYGASAAVSFRNSLLAMGIGWLSGWCALVIQGATTGKALWVSADKIQPIQFTAGQAANSFFVSFALHERFEFPVNCASFWPGDAALNVIVVTDLSSGVFTVFSDYASILYA